MLKERLMHVMRSLDWIELRRPAVNGHAYMVGCLRLIRDS